jgi:DNA-binding transcriptional LysR family regulator
MNEWAEFRHFRYLLTILELQSFRAAAEALHTSQPNLSVQAKRFQEHVSVRLYRRTKSGRIRITEQGRAFMNMAHLLLETRDEILQELSELEQSESTVVRLGCVAHADPLVFKDFCSLYRAMLPGCSIRARFGDKASITHEIAEGRLDAAITTLPTSGSTLQTELVRREPLVVCMREDDPLAAKRNLSSHDLQRSSLVLYDAERPPLGEEPFVHLLKGRGLNVDEYARASHPSEIQALVRDGFGIALVRAGEELQSKLTTRPLLDIDWTVDTAVVFREVGHLKTTPVVIRQLQQRYRTQGFAPSWGEPSAPAKRPARSVPMTGMERTVANR